MKKQGDEETQNDMEIHVLSHNAAYKIAIQAICLFLS